MKTFMAVYTGSASGAERAEWNALDPQQRKAREQAGMAAWDKWGKANQKAIVDNGTPLGKTKRISRQGISDSRNNIAAYTIVQAESHEAAAKLFEITRTSRYFPETRSRSWSACRCLIASNRSLHS